MAENKKTVESYAKGSILPSIVDVEQELKQREEEAHRRAAEMIEEAKRYRERTIAETKQHLPELEAAEQAAILNEVDSRAEDLKTEEDAEIAELTDTISRNRPHAVEMIVREIVPGWSGTLPGNTP